MARYLIPWSVSGEFEVEALSSSEAAEKFRVEWNAGAIQPRRDGKLWERRPVELVTDIDEDT